MRQSIVAARQGLQRLKRVSLENWGIQSPSDGKFHGENMRCAAVIVSVSPIFCGKAMKPLLQEHRSGAYAAQIVMKPEFYEKTLEKLDFIVSLIGEA